MWEDVRASIAWLVVAGPPVAGPPVEEAVHLQDKVVDKVVEVPLPVQEEVHMPVTSRWKITVVFRSLATCARQKGSRAS